MVPLLQLAHDALDMEVFLSRLATLREFELAFRIAELFVASPERAQALETLAIDWPLIIAQLWEAFLQNQLKAYETSSDTIGLSLKRSEHVLAEQRQWAQDFILDPRPLMQHYITVMTPLQYSRFLTLLFRVKVD